MVPATISETMASIKQRIVLHMWSFYPLAASSLHRLYENATSARGDMGRTVSLGRISCVNVAEVGKAII